MQTTVDNAGAPRAEWQQLESLENVAKPDPKIWATVERVDTGDDLDDGPSEPLKPGMKKTTWNVRR
jgi:hypothetical protein